MLIVAIHILELLIDEAAMPRGIQVLGCPPTVSFRESPRKTGLGAEAEARGKPGCWVVQMVRSAPQ